MKNFQVFPVCDKQETLLEKATRFFEGAKVSQSVAEHAVQMCDEIERQRTLRGGSFNEDEENTLEYLQQVIDQVIGAASPRNIFVNNFSGADWNEIEKAMQLSSEKRWAEAADIYELLLKRIPSPPNRLVLERRLTSLRTMQRVKR